MAFIGIILVLIIGSIFLFGLGFVLSGLNGLRKWGLMYWKDPSDSGPDPGLQEFKGRARAIDEPVTAPFSGSQSLICDWEVARPGAKAGTWKPVESDVESVPFEVEQGGQAVVAVEPYYQHSSLDIQKYHLTRELQADTRDTDDLPPRVQEYAEENLDSEGRFRFTEKRLDEGDDVYVLGPAETDTSSVPGDTSAQLVVAPSEPSWLQSLQGYSFVISDSGEKRARRQQLKSAIIAIIIGLVFAVPTGYMLFGIFL